MTDKMYGYHLPIDISTNGWQIDHIIHLMHWFMIVLFAGWFTFFVFTLFKFRARPGHKANYAPKYSKFSSYLEVGIACFEAFVLVMLAAPAWKVAKASIPTSSDRLEIKIVGEQYVWNIQYPGADGKFGKMDSSLMNSDNPMGLDSNDPAGKDDLILINTLHVPQNRPILIYLTSKDVIHSFGVPALRVKQDAVPGMLFPVYFQTKPNTTGDYDIVCSQLCGLGHYRMKGTLSVDTEEGFKKWFAEQKDEGAL